MRQVTLILLACLMMAGCTSVYYQGNDAQLNKPQMSLKQVHEDLKQIIQRGFVNPTSFGGAPNEDVTVSDDAMSFKSGGNAYTYKYFDFKNMTVQDPTIGWYSVILPGEDHMISWRKMGDAKTFVNDILAMKYFATPEYIMNDPENLAAFENSAQNWLAANPKPSLPEEVHRFRVLGDDAVANKNFKKAADFYEQGLTIDPLWPAGQYNVAMIYKELEDYPFAIMHMKRYLVLKPEDVSKYKDQMYIWEEKANESSNSSDNSNNQSEQAH